MITGVFCLRVMPIRLRYCAFAALITLAACPGSRDKLLADLQSPRPEARALAVKQLAGQGRTEDLVLFTQAAKDPAAVVRGEAIAALGKSQDARVVDLLGELLGDPDDAVQAKAAMALAEIKGDKAKAYLTLQYGRRSRATRQAIVQALKSANVPGAMAGVIAAEAKGIWERNLQALNEGTLAERVGAAEELGKSGRAEAVNRLLPLIKDSQVVLAAAAVRGLGHAGDRRAAGPIAELLSENFPELREAACESLLRLQEPSVLPRLREVAIERSSASPLAAAAIIAMPRGPETDKALCDVALEGAFGEAVAAGRELRRRGGCPAEALADKLRNPANHIQVLQAVQGLGPSAASLTPKLLPLLTASDPQVRYLAVEALAEVADPQAAPAVQKLYDQEQKSLQVLRAKWIPTELPLLYAPGFDPAQASASADQGSSARAKQAELFRKVRELADAKAKEAKKTLLEARAPSEVVDDASDEQVKLLASTLRALGALHADGALSTLKPWAGESSPRLRTAAYLGLSRLGPEGIAIARAGLLDADRDVQGAVAQELAEVGEAGQAAILEVLPQLAGDKMRLLEPLIRTGVGAQAAATMGLLVKEGGAEAAAAAYIMGEVRAREAVDGLVKYLDDPTGVARREVLLALGKIGDSRAAETVGRDLYHDSADVRAAAAEALASVGSAAQLEALDALKGDYYRKVRDSAEQALSRIGSAPPEPHK
ncbi:MAG: HEAT repeat domain-containing protein [Myxococcaceae bacterium]